MHERMRVSVRAYVFQLCRLLSPVEKMAAILAAASHDVDHPGVNQSFLTATDNPLASLYAVSIGKSHRVTVFARLIASAVIPLRGTRVLGYERRTAIRTFKVFMVNPGIRPVREKLKSIKQFHSSCSLLAAY